MMLKRFGHITLSLLAALIWVSCDGKTDTPDPIPADKMVNLCFSVGVTDAMNPSESRALVTIPDGNNYFEREANKYEKIRTLRVIILRPAITTDAEGNPLVYKEVEHNKLFTLAEDGTVYYDDLTFEVIGGEDKRIYLLANEDGVNINRAESDRVDFNSIAVKGEAYTGKIEAIEISSGTNGFLYENTPEAATYIPMSEVYDNVHVDLPDQINKRKQTVGPFFITRSAVKFSFTISAAGPNESFSLKSVKFKSLANKEFYLPNNTDYDPPIEDPGVQNPDGFPNISGHFITKYDIPEDANHSDFNFEFDSPVKIKQTPVTISPLLYFCESKYNTSLSGNPTMDDHPYELSIQLTSPKLDKDGKPVTDLSGNPVEIISEFGPTPLRNLPLLPRNTHVRVNMTLTGKDLSCEVVVVPYTGIWLNPNFGIEDRE